MFYIFYKDLILVNYLGKLFYKEESELFTDS